MKNAFIGALTSRMMWWNLILAVVAVIELSGGYLTTLWGPKGAAAILLGGAIVNKVLRSVTVEPLDVKGERMMK